MAQLAREVALGQTSGVLSEPQGFTRITSQRRQTSRSVSLNRADVEVASPPVVQQDNYVQGPPETQGESENESFSRRVRLGISASWVINVVLLIAKIVAFVLSSSYAVLASAVDSLVDTLSQAVLSVAVHKASRHHQRFPIGRTRISELAVLACAAIMFISTAIVIREAIGSLWEGWHGHPPKVNAEPVLFIVLGSATGLKVLLWVYCRTLMRNPIMVALAQDHLNDVMSNVAAIVGAAVSGYVRRCWYVDPLMAAVMSLVIIWNWLVICWEQGQKMIGLEAPEELVSDVKDAALSHHGAMLVDRITAYHHGSNVVVEVDVVLPASMSVLESHDIAVALQHKLEAIDMVERAFVHVDYERRELGEHKVERNLLQGEKDIMKPLQGYLPPPRSQTQSQSATQPQSATQSQTETQQSPVPLLPPSKQVSPPQSQARLWAQPSRNQLPPPSPPLPQRPQSQKLQQRPQSQKLQQRPQSQMQQRPPSQQLQQRPQSQVFLQQQRSVSSASSGSAAAAAAAVLPPAGWDDVEPADDGTPGTAGAADVGGEEADAAGVAERVASAAMFVRRSMPPQLPGVLEGTAPES